MPVRIENGVLRASVALDCLVCRETTRCDVIGGADYSVSVARITYGCDCPDRPAPEEAEQLAAEMFDDFAEAHGR